MKKSSIKKIRTVFGVSEYRLSNGLRVLYRQEKSAPVVAVCITFHVGSRNEAKGHTGSTHILEHLLFKNSEQFKKEEGKELATLLEGMGASLNATTWFDRTNYYEMLPVEHLEVALHAESDRMRGSLFSDADLASEMTVVRNEFERGRNNPFELLEEAIMETAFTTHPYRINTIGTQEDIEGSTATKLREFYDVYYWPNNATLTVTGDVPWSKVEKLVLKYFGPIASSPHKIPEMTIKEPTQKSPRKVALKKAMGVSIASLYYKTPPATHPDYAALLAATVILGGGFSSRLQKEVVDKGIAADASSLIFPLRDPGVAIVSAHAAHGVEPSKVLSVLRTVVKQFAKDGPSKEELERAQERILSQFAQERDGVLNEARGVSEAIAAGDWTLFYKLEKDVAKLTPQKVAAVVKKYFVSSGETAGTLLNK